VDPCHHDWSEDQLRRALGVTVDDLFSTVAEALRYGADSLFVTYDTQRGYPEYVSIDYDIRMADDEIVFQAKLDE
jgi:hypothetical protein